MTEEDKKIYKSISRKIMDDKKDTLTEEETLWLKERPELMAIARRMAAKAKIMSNFKDCKGTIEEIIFMLDLSDRFIR